ncbi:MAG: hypothetical protein KIT11_01630 [Fimbriimonadaceae bacterium]|nr:hypothetical protein [Fimbriimonadaceae bacterium]QYK54929.1 MAG: hypothetical protein KF733_07905 [Fimbriimonadaceae bacterium]
MSNENGGLGRSESMRRITAALTLAVASLALAQQASVVGTWNGKVELKVPDEMKAQMKQAPPMPSLKLVFDKAGTYVATQKMPNENTEHKTEGTWRASGNKVVLTPKKRDGKAVSGEGAKERTYILAKDGKTMTMDLTSQMAKNAGGQAPKGMKVTVILKKA